MKNIFVALMLIMVVACSPSDKVAHQIESSNHFELIEREHQDWLSHNEAKIRHKQVSDVRYALDFDLTDDKNFSGTSTITFELKENLADLTIDFSGGSVKWLKVAGVDTPYQYNDFFITLKKSALKLGANQIEIGFEHPYSDNGSGLYRYVDSEDGNVYIYSNFEPYNANKLFPSFDQPNLRATFDLSVTAPKDWVVISAAKEKSITDDKGVNKWVFHTSPDHSTYIFPLHAGNYHVWEDSYKNVPLKLFSRQSLAKHVDAQWWFDVTKKGLKFFNEYFDYDYPYTKYDQLLVPDFNGGGMENVAAVTYYESAVSRGKMTENRKQRIAGLLLHEMAHMWFGDLVTIDWWGGLWLKESFATYMSNLSLEKTGISNSAWNLFYTRTKQRAYVADERVTTHPIQMPVSDTKSGVASFDSITYSKGASVLNQLTHNLGDEVFRDGVRAYFKQFQNQATKLPDFMETLAKVAKTDLNKWSEDWLYNSGVNRIQADFQCESGKITEFKIIQTAPEQFPTLREHAIQVGLYSIDEEEKKFGTQSTQAMKISGKETRLENLMGKDCPDLVYPNHGDWGYVKVLLDDNTLEKVSKALPVVEDPMLKAMLYQSLWDLVQDVKLPLSTYIDIVKENVHKETDTNVLNLVLSSLSRSRSYLNRLSSDKNSVKIDYLLQLEKYYWSSLLAAPAGSDVQKIWAGRMVSMMQSEKGLDQLISILEGDLLIEGLDVDQDIRWDMIVQLQSFSHKSIAELLAKESLSDKSHKGKLSAIKARAATPSISEKEYWFAEFEKENDRLTASEQKTAMSRLNLSHQIEIYKPFADRAIADLVKFDKYRDQDLIDYMVYYLMPSFCTAESVARLESTILQNPQLGLVAMKGLKNLHQEDQRCVDISKLL